jgi:sterol desaturase/sphingolipid hydroxylase (fatty acid hydroxylase superfamily)
MVKEIPDICLPGFDISQGIFRAWWLEPLVATLSFTISIHVYWYEERRRGLSRNNVLFETLSLSSMGDLYNSLVAYWVGNYFLKTIASTINQNLALADGIPEGLSGYCTLICEVLFGILMYDGIFFVFHLFLHEVSWMKAWHKKHHDAPSSTLEARDVLRHSILDGSLQVVCNILVQQYNPWGVRKSRLARLVHNIIVPWMLTESHSAASSPWIWRRWFVGVREHRLHHFGRTKHKDYDQFQRCQQFFGYLDGIRALLLKQHKGSSYGISSK